METQRSELEQTLRVVPVAPTPALPPTSSEQATQTEAPPATAAMATPTSPNPCFVSVGTQAKADGAMAIQKLEEDITTYKAIAEKAKVRLDEARKDAEQQEAMLRKTIADQSAQLCEADEKVTTAITSFQDIATTQIATVTKELVDMQAWSSMFLQPFEQGETECTTSSRNTKQPPSWSARLTTKSTCKP